MPSVSRALAIELARSNSIQCQENFISDQLRERGVKPAPGRAFHDPGDLTGKMFFNILATFAQFEADLIRMRTREGMAIARARRNSAACPPPASIPSAISPSFSPSQDQLSIAH